MYPKLEINLTGDLNISPKKGNVVYRYAPFQNLLVDKEFTNFRVPTSNIGLDITKPIDIQTEYSYDGTTNVILNDRTNPLKLINSRFYLTSREFYEIPEKRTLADNSVYTLDKLQQQTSFIKIAQSISNITFLGISEGGRMPVGSYYIYIKLSDKDGNETDFIAESSKIICHIGTPNDPKSIRGGQAFEDSGKNIELILNNVDMMFMYINVYYVTFTDLEGVESAKAYKVLDKIDITGINVPITLSGYENIEEIPITDINAQYVHFSSVGTSEVVQNLNFVGNITKNYELFKILEKASLGITPSIVNDQSVGFLNNSTYLDISTSANKYEYYNVNNIYYRLGYWPGEIYRFGIVYIMNDYSLSPVFNIRGRNVINNSSKWSDLDLSEDIQFGEDFIIHGTNDNVKGVFRISPDSTVFAEKNITPIGIKFTFQESLLGGVNDLKHITKGFFIVRQKRIPTILAQGVPSRTFKKSNTPAVYHLREYYGNSFLENIPPNENTARWTFYNILRNKSDSNYWLFSKNRLSSNILSLGDEYASNSILFCPDLVFNPTYTNVFSGGEFVLESYIQSFSSGTRHSNRIVTNNSVTTTSLNKSTVVSNLLTIPSGVSLLRLGNRYFSSKAGDESVSYKHADFKYGDYADMRNMGLDSEFTKSYWKTRGIFNTYIASSENLSNNLIYSVYIKGYDFTSKWKDYFKTRYNDHSPYYSVTDRYSWNNIPEIVTGYRGDCYISTYTHRVNWNFQDPELPTNSTIVDPFTWEKNFRVVEKTTETLEDNPDIGGLGVEYTTGLVKDTLTYRKLLEDYTFKMSIVTGEEDSSDYIDFLEPTDKGYNKALESAGSFGAERINRPDINALNLGLYYTFKICSNNAIMFRDVDFNNPMEEALFGEKRSFYPLNEESRLPESNILNKGISKTTGEKIYVGMPDVPFIKTNFTNRIHYSIPLLNSAFVNNHRIFPATYYEDYTMEHGALIKLVEWYGTLIGIMEHGVMMIPVNERALMANASGENVYINTENVLPKNPKILSNTYGSRWSTSIVKTDKYIYGLDTVGKKIWRTNGQNFETISDLKIQKFLNDNIDLPIKPTFNLETGNFIKTHYNAFKGDVIFTFKYKDTAWSLCWNELLNKWVTRYSWFSEFSENIDNNFYTFAHHKTHDENTKGILYKHGFAGHQGTQGDIYPTKWYDEQQSFEFEFVVNDTPGVQKIFDNLKIISNRTAPESFAYEIVGEGFGWSDVKEDILGFTESGQFTNFLQVNSDVKKVPYVFTNSFNKLSELPFFYRNREEEIFGPSGNWALARDITLRKDNKSKEVLVNTYQHGLDIRKHGRLRGNMQYVEDSWDIQIQPITFKYVYLKNSELNFSNTSEMKIRDKYIKIRVKYTGDKYAFIYALKTFYTISYA